MTACRVRMDPEGQGEMVTSFRGWDGEGEVGVREVKGEGGVKGVRRVKGGGLPSLPVLHLSLESLGQMQELYYSYEDCLRNAYSM